jgi:hypothetical protein
MVPIGYLNPADFIKPPYPSGKNLRTDLGELKGEGNISGNLSVCGSIMEPVGGTGLLPLIFCAPRRGWGKNLTGSTPGFSQSAAGILRITV